MFLFLCRSNYAEYWCIRLGRYGSSESIPHTIPASSLGESGATKDLSQGCEFDVRANGWSTRDSAADSRRRTKSSNDVKLKSLSLLYRR